MCIRVSNCYDDATSIFTVVCHQSVMYALDTLDSAIPVTDPKYKQEAETEELTEAELERVVDIQLTETDTLWLLDLK